MQCSRSSALLCSGTSQSTPTSAISSHCEELSECGGARWVVLLSKGRRKEGGFLRELDPSRYHDGRKKSNKVQYSRCDNERYRCSPLHTVATVQKVIRYPVGECCECGLFAVIIFHRSTASYCKADGNQKQERESFWTCGP